MGKNIVTPLITITDLAQNHKIYIPHLCSTPP